MTTGGGWYVFKNMNPKTPLRASTQLLLGIGALGVPNAVLYAAGAMSPARNAPWALPTLIAVQMTCLVAGLVKRRIERRKR